MAAEHGLAPLAFQRLKQGGARSYVPADVWRMLRRIYFYSVSANARIYRALGPVLRSLCNSGIPVIVLKGAYLAAAVYEDAALRPMGDVDILVREADLERAQAVLLGLGGAIQTEAEFKSNKGDSPHLLPVVLGDLPLDIHWTIVRPTGPVAVDTDGLWDRACTCSIAGAEVLALSSEDLMLHLCLHACYQNRLAKPLNLYDVAVTTGRFGDRLHWEQLAQRAHNWGAERHVGLTLQLARGILGAHVPGAALEQLVPGGVDADIYETARQSVLTQTDYNQFLPIFGPLGAATLKEKAMVTWQRVFLSREAMAAAYPQSREKRHLLFYYALRLRDVIRTYLSHAHRRSRALGQSRGQGGHAALTRWLRSDRPNLR